ncbi:hydrolase, alpha/beta fold family, putative [Synechococcus sp. PCC 7335]|uniref:alpha/beta fold hydrolase n=1 Tax=Synechococcus sp. (strain ATCC 29403 / PCC 7335) TaxID=91464 RepID=UPI00017ED9C5|nr:alpha/beta hydrolase [Synechococcus sp. PCC 7335]EDX84821.1 hydrolase, alpha/beta fold family, putative [Synechococcus sp. PCC 7335]
MDMLTESIRGVPHAYDFTQARSQTNSSIVQTSDRSYPLVFIHGWLLSRTYWQPLVQTLSLSYRCLTYDMRGFGESVLPSDLSHEQLDTSFQVIELPAGRSLFGLHRSQKSETYQASTYSLAAYAKDLESLLDQLDIDQVWLLGHSLGGSIALWAAYLLPERIKGVICINAGGGVYIENEFKKFRAAGQQMLKFRPNWLAQLPLLPRLFARLMVKQPLSVSWGQQRIRDFVRANAQAASGALLESTTAAEVYLLPQVISALAQPVHFITATEDTVMPRRYVDYLASFHSGFARGQIVSEIANCGHMAMIEQPEKVAQIIHSVLQSKAFCSNA